MTRRVSDGAVCCSSASVRSRLRASSSLKRRTFSMAMTAWSAKVWRSFTCVSLNGFTSARRSWMAPMATSSRNRGTFRMVRCPHSLPRTLPSGNSSASAWTSATWIVCRSSTVRPVVVPPPGVGGGRGAGGDAEDFARHHLPFQCLLGLVEQPHVLDGNHGLVGKSAEQFDLGRREGAQLCATHHDDPDGVTTSEHRHREDRAEAPHTWVVPELVAARWIRIDIGYVVHRLRDHGLLWRKTRDGPMGSPEPLGGDSGASRGAAPRGCYADQLSVISDDRDPHRAEQVS